MSKTVTVTLTLAQAIWIETLIVNAAKLQLSARATALNGAAYRALLVARGELVE